VKLSGRVARLEARLTEAAPRVRTDPLGDRVMYEPTEEDLAEALAILVECGAVREVRS